MLSSAQDPDPGALALASRLQQARARLGVSGRELSRRAGIPVATISAIEGGRDPRWSTLVRYLETVPGLRAADLVPSAIRHPPAASPSLHDYLRHACGQGAQAVHVEWTRAPGPDGARGRGDAPGRRDAPGRGDAGATSGGCLRLIVEDLGTDLLHASRSETVRRLMQLACIGSTETIRSLRAPEDGSLTLNDEEAEQSFSVSEGDPLLLRYERVQRVPSVSAPPTSVEHAAGYAVQSLTLSAEIPEGRPARLLVWPLSRRIEGATAEIASYLYPGSLRPAIRRDGARITVTIPEVIPGLVHVLDWSDDPRELQGTPGLALEATDPAEGFGPIATSLRARSGLSLRALADAMDMSHATIAAAEKESDPRASTLRRYLSALPDVAPQWLLPAREARGELTPEEAWEALRDLHGVEAASLERTLVVAPDGTGTTTTFLGRVRSLDGRERPLALSNLQSANIHGWGKQETLRLEVEGDSPDDDGDVVFKVLPGRPGSPEHHVRIPAGLSARGISLRRCVLTGMRHLLTREDVEQRYGPTDELVVSGMSLTAHLPVRMLIARLVLPPGFRPLSVWPIALPFDRPYDEVPLGLLDVAHPGRYRWRPSQADPDDGALREHVLEVDRPLYGLKYGIGWSI